MKKITFTVSPIPATDTSIVKNNLAAGSLVMVPPTVTASLPTTTSASIVPVLPAYAKPFLDISRIEVFNGYNSKGGKNVFIPPWICMEWHGCCSMKMYMSTLRLGHCWYPTTITLFKLKVYDVVTKGLLSIPRHQTIKLVVDQNKIYKFITLSPKDY